MDKDKDYVDKPFLWFRYIDDILMVWIHGNEKFDCFIAYLNNIHPTIKFTSERSTTSIPFLDVNILLESGKIEPDLYCKHSTPILTALFKSSLSQEKISALQPCSPFTTYLFKR